MTEFQQVVFNSHYDFKLLVNCESYIAPFPRHTPLNKKNHDLYIQLYSSSNDREEKNNHKEYSHPLYLDAPADVYSLEFRR